MWLVMLAVGCDEATLCEDAAAYEPSVNVGWGEDDFNPISDAPVDAVSGPQLGKHVWLAFQGQGLVPGAQIGWSELVQPPVVEVELSDDDGNLWATGNAMFPWSGNVEESEVTGVQLVITWEWFMWDPESPDDDLIEPPEDRAAYLTGVVEDVCGTVVEIDQELVVSALDR
jgi:hypothetical protein